MSGNNHANLRQALVEIESASIKHFDELTGVHPGHTRCWGMSQDVLDLGMLQDLISLPPRHEIHPCEHDLRDDNRIAIVSIETDQRHFWWKCKERQVGGDGLRGRGEFTTIVPIALVYVRSDPLRVCI